MPPSPLPPEPPPTASKEEWRVWARQVRAGLPDRSAEVLAPLRAFLRERGVRRVLAYCAMGGEPDVSALAGEFELFTTRTRYRPQRHLTVHPWASATETTRFGYRQPPAGAPRVDPATLDAALLPGLAFDRRGVRLGYGGGFYDRLLPGFAGLTLGVVWDELLRPELPSEAHDVRVQGVATPSGIVLVRGP